jgi:Ca2+-binding EF-hand superfamily protein
MKRSVSIVSATAMLAVAWLSIRGQSGGQASDNDAYHLIYFQPSSPVIVRLHIRIGGKPPRAAWDQFLAALFAHLDRDGNGVLSQAVLDLAPTREVLSGVLFGNSQPPKRVESRPMPEVAVSLVGGKVTQEGLATYYRMSGIDPFHAYYQDRSTRAEALTDAIFKHLDVNQDGKLSKEELLSAAATLAKLDLDDDETISIDELLPSRDVMVEMAAVRSGELESLGESSSFFLVSPGESPARLITALFGRYDKDNNEKLSRTEIGLDKRLFDQLDANGDGELDRKELAKFLDRCPAHIELQLDVSDVANTPDKLRIVGPAKSQEPGVQENNHGPFVSFSVADTAMSVRSQGDMNADFHAKRAVLVQQFQAADPSYRGFVERQQLQNRPALAQVFAYADRDGDGKLTVKELTAYLDLLGKAAASSVTLVITDRGRGLFDLLDSRHDGRLRQYDLLRAWSRLAPLDRDGDECISRSEIPHQFDILIRHSSPSTNLVTALRNTLLPPSSSEGRPAPPRGPIWFRKMDRNGDGYVSLREFLGSKEEFQKIDTDGDGLISLEEAERADARYREAKKERP